METNTLSAEDVKFLRWARKQSRVTFYASWTPSTDCGYAKVTAEVRRDDVPGADSEPVYTEHSRVLPLRGWVERYSRDNGPSTYSALDLFAGTYGVSGGTLLGLLDSGVKEGDTLAAYWQIANNSENLTSAGLSHDLCYLALDRNGSFKGGRMLLDDRIHKAGDTAGMEHPA